MLSSKYLISILFTLFFVILKTSLSKDYKNLIENKTFDEAAYEILSRGEFVILIKFLNLF